MAKRVSIGVATQDQLDDVRDGTLIDVRWPGDDRRRQYVMVRRHGLAYAADPASRLPYRRLDFAVTLETNRAEVNRATLACIGTRLPFLIDVPWASVNCLTWYLYLYAVEERARYLVHHGLVDELAGAAEMQALAEVRAEQSETLARAFVEKTWGYFRRYPPVTARQVVDLLKSGGHWPKVKAQ